MSLDPEIIRTFQLEANELLVDLREIVDALDDSQDVFPKELLQDFANKVDRIMGTAETFDMMYPGNPEFQQIGRFSALCKALGYKASTLQDLGLITIFAAFWADTLDILQDLVDNVGDSEKLKEATKGYVPVLQSRLIWLGQKIVAAAKATPGSDQGQINVDGLLKKLGIDV